MPLDLGDDAARLLPALRLIDEAGIVVPHLVRRSPDRAFKQVFDLVLQDPVGRQQDCVASAFGFKEFIYLGIGKGYIAPEVEALHDIPVARDHRLQHRMSTVGAVHVAGPEGAPLDIAQLIEHEQRVIAGTAEMTVVGAALPARHRSGSRSKPCRAR